ncbi:MAG: CRISPR-associated protein Csx20 [Bacteroidia bacterium]|nr:CRISPR-associated protein Csx20 [Bacteroidia bacterium]MDW8157466.1 CRISPR-associated protein Csx20 [Bacteroidia bacterium]
MARLLTLLNHTLTEEQEQSAFTTLGITEILVLPSELASKWGKISPQGDLPLDELIPFQNWIMENSEPQDYVLFQGEMGATFYLVTWLLAQNRIPIYSTTERKVIEEKAEDGTLRKINLFKHVCYRRYVMYVS